MIDFGRAIQKIEDLYEDLNQLTQIKFPFGYSITILSKTTTYITERTMIMKEIQDIISGKSQKEAETMMFQFIHNPDSEVELGYYMIITEGLKAIQQIMHPEQKAYANTVGQA